MNRSRRPFFVADRDVGDSHLTFCTVPETHHHTRVFVQDAPFHDVVQVEVAHLMPIGSSPSHPDGFKVFSDPSTGTGNSRRKTKPTKTGISRDPALEKQTSARKPNISSFKANPAIVQDCFAFASNSIERLENVCKYRSGCYQKPDIQTRQPIGLPGDKRKFFRWLRVSL